MVPGGPPDDDDEAEKVGYGRPPRQYRWPKGHCPNPNGRRGKKGGGKKKIKETPGEILDRLLDAEATVRTAAGPRKVSVFEGLAKKQIEKAGAGDLKAFKELVALRHRLGSGQPQPAGSEAVDADDEALIAEFLRRARGEGEAERGPGDRDPDGSEGDDRDDGREDER
jgi:hypothetical protein